MVLDNILPSELDPADRIRQLALKDRLDMKASGAHLIEDEIATKHKVPIFCSHAASRKMILFMQVIMWLLCSE